MLNLITSALQDTEVRLNRFLALLSTRTGLSPQEIAQIWADAAPVAEQPIPVAAPAIEKVVAAPVAEQPIPVAVPVIEKVVAAPVVEQPIPVTAPVIEKVVVAPPPVVQAPPPADQKNDDDDLPMVKSSSVSSRCRHIMVAGKSKGQACGAPAKENGYCTKHKTSSSGAVENKVEAKPEVKVEHKPKPKEPTPPKEEPPVEFVKLTVREEEKKIEFRMKKRELLLDHSDYPPVPTCVYKKYTLVEDTRVVLNDEETTILGYLDAKDQLMRTPTPETDKIVIKYGLPFDTSHISDDDIDD